MYGNNFVIIEQCSVDTKTMWWNSHNHSKWAFICKYNCTIKGLELKVVLEEKLCGLDKLSLLFINKKPLQLKTLSAWMLVAATQRYFSHQPPKSWKLWPPWPPLALVQSWLQGNNYKLQILSFSIIKVRSHKKNDIIWEFFPTWGGGLPKSQKFCKFTKYFFVCQIQSEVLKHVL